MNGFEFTPKEQALVDFLGFLTIGVCLFGFLGVITHELWFMTWGLGTWTLVCVCFLIKWTVKAYAEDSHRWLDTDHRDRAGRR